MKQPKLIVYGSSYDRGLEHLLKMWPDIKKEVPDAMLHCFYGWDLFARFYADNPERMAWMAKMNKMMEYDGIIHLGRISNLACAEEMDKAAIWAYPTHFGEISCITAMRAQAYGAIPVVINYAALTETVQHGIKIDGDIYEPEVRLAFKNALVSLLNDEKRQEEIRGPMMEWAKRFSWKNVAAQWDQEFKVKNLEKEIEDLLDHNQALKAYELSKGTEFEKKIYPLVEHAFDPKVYKDYYTNDLTEPITPEENIFRYGEIPRFSWLFQKLQGRKGTLIDLGCADGSPTLIMAKMGFDCVGVNLHTDSVVAANKRAEKFKLPAKFICQDIMEATGEYDVVVMFEILEHLPDPAGSIKHAYSLVKPGGSLFMSTPRVDHTGVDQHIKNKYNKVNPPKPWSEQSPAGHLRLWTEQEFKELLKDYTIVSFDVDSENDMLAEVKKV